MRKGPFLCAQGEGVNECSPGLRRAPVGAAGDAVAKPTVINAPRHFSLFATSERYFPFQTQLEIRLVTRRSAALSPWPLNDRSPWKGEEWPRSPAPVHARGVAVGCQGGSLWAEAPWLFTWGARGCKQGPAEGGSSCGFAGGAARLPWCVQERTHLGNDNAGQQPRDMPPGGV